MPHYLRLLCCFACASWLLASCNKDLTLPNTASEKKIVLLGELTAGDSIYFRAGQSIPLTSGGSGQELIRNLSVSIKDGTGVSTALQGGEDFLSLTLFTIPYSSPEVIQARGQYQVTATHPQLGEVMAAVTIPGPFAAATTATAFTNYNGDSVLSFDIEITDPNAADARYVIEAVKQPLAIHGYFYVQGNEYSISDNRTLYDSLKGAGVIVSERYDTSYSGMYSRQQMYTSDNISENLRGTSPGRLFKRVFLLGKSFGGTLHRTRILIPRNAIYGAQGQFAETVVYVKSVAADYYDFLKAYEQYDPSMGLGTNANPVKLQGNIAGGFGMIGGVNRWTFSVIY